MPDPKALLLAALLLPGAALADMPSAAKISQHICAPLAEHLFLTARGKPSAATPKTAAERARAEARERIATWRGPRGRDAWNDLCAARPDAAAGELLVRQVPATMRVRGDVLSISGVIDAAFERRLTAKLDGNPQVRRVSLASPGGEIGVAMRAGVLLRARGLDTEAAGACLSACPLVFLGGRTRSLRPGAGRLGFHQAAWLNGTPVSAINPVQAQMGHHVASMGGAALDVLGWMHAASPRDMHMPERRALCAAGIVTRPTCPDVAPAKR